MVLTKHAFWISRRLISPRCNRETIAGKPHEKVADLSCRWRFGAHPARSRTGWHSSGRRHHRRGGSVCKPSSVSRFGGARRGRSSGLCFFHQWRRASSQSASTFCIYGSQGKGLAHRFAESAAASVASGIKLRENVYVDRGTRLLPGASIGANSWVMQGSELGANSKIGSSCWVGSYCRVSERATLGKNCTLGDGVIIGPDVVLPAWSTIKGRTCVMHSPATTLFTDLRFKSSVFLFDKTRHSSN